MENQCLEHPILHDLLKTCHRQFGFHVLESEPIRQGWLNLKWKITTDTGIYLIKQYNKERLKLYNREELDNAFHQQNRLHKRGLPCPMLLSYGGEYLFHSDQDELFTIMEYCDGVTMPPGKVTSSQIFHLGKMTGYMHQILNERTLAKRHYPAFIIPTPKERSRHWRDVWKQTHNTSLSTIIETQIKVTEMVNFEEFNQNTGWAHRDLWVDNILFKEGQVSAILDFDRLKFDYPQLDVARAVISAALADEVLDTALASAFLEGYGEYCPVEKSFLTDSLKLLWYMECTWWINANMNKHTGPPVRFAEEMVWLANHYVDLELILGGL
ncbi:phosphotransferase [Bacillus sp. SD088]|uniref:phosphotransferase n=1 Tax=Bacillus sp. SD088 TaxID=2782012 RepID=UPI001A9598B0|nr:phosphotransferase [Bacillus sp. SD088]MBO0991834.1 phosphotransferase [Bacillus sp. SD088]